MRFINNVVTTAGIEVIIVNTFLHRALMPLSTESCPEKMEDAPSLPNATCTTQLNMRPLSIILIIQISMENNDYKKIDIYYRYSN